MPVAQLIIEPLIFDCLQSLAKTEPATTHRLDLVANTALIHELLRHVLIRVADLLELDDAAIIGIVLGHDLLGHGRLPTDNARALARAVGASGWRASALQGVDFAGLRVLVLVKFGSASLTSHI